jgi:hypothetical protein
MEFHRGLVRTYDATTHTAAVLLVGSLSRTILAVPVSHHIPPHHMLEGTACALAFFADAHPIVIATFGDPASPTEAAAWHDHFMGDSLAPEYSTTAVGAGTIALQPLHGGVLTITTGAVTWNYNALNLGTASHSLATLDADSGWLQIARLRLQGTTTQNRTLLGGQNAAADVIFAGSETGYANWVLITQLVTGWHVIPSAIPIDTAWHDHAIRLLPTATGHEIKHFLDAALINTVTTYIPTAPITAQILTQTATNAAKVSQWDHWSVIPYQLA